MGRGHHHEGAPKIVVKAFWMSQRHDMVGNVQLLGTGKPRGSDHPLEVAKTWDVGWRILEGTGGGQ